MSKTTSTKGQIFRTIEERIEVGKKIYAEYSKGLHSLESIGRKYKVAPTSLFEWTQKYEELERAKKNANELLKAPNPDELKVKARVSLERLITGYKYEEKTTDIETTATGAIKSQKIRRVEKHVHPDTTAIIFALKNTDPDNFNKGANDTTLTVGEITIEAITQQITPDVLEASAQARRDTFDRIRKQQQNGRA